MENRSNKDYTHKEKIRHNVSKEKFTRCYKCNQKSKLFKCQYCDNYFCHDCCNPKMPLTPKLVFSEKNPLRSQLYEKEWRKGGHPCVIYGEKKLNEIIEKEKEVAIPITRIFPPRTEAKSEASHEETPKRIEKVKKPDYEDDFDKDGFYKDSYPTTKRHGRISKATLIVIIFLITIGFFAYLNFDFIFDNLLGMISDHICESSNVLAYNTTSSFGRDPFTYCQKTCVEKYNTTNYKVIEPSGNDKTTICYCNITSCDQSKSLNLNIFSSFVPKCSDNTPYNQCSAQLPLYCYNGTLKDNASFCGCPYDYKVNVNECSKIQRCTDGTAYGECSTQKPLYCNNGVLANKSSLCGCRADEVSQGDSCISKFEVGPKQISYTYVLRGSVSMISFTSYKGLNDYLASISRSYVCNPACPSDEEIELRYINQDKQAQYLDVLVDKIRSQITNNDDQARIAISLVQNIPYDWSGFTTGGLSGRYPYEVLYDNTGVCGEKSHLLAFILKELGYGTVLFNYESQSHMAVGIKCPMQYSYENSGYCFIESTTPSIITDSSGDYVNAGKLYSPSATYEVSDGNSFDSVSEEYNDANTWKMIEAMSESSGRFLDPGTYYTWTTLVAKYGIKLS